MTPDLAAGRCHAVNPEVMHPTRPEDTRVAKAVCWRCPVLAACRAHALATAEPYGVWGGLSEAERRRIRTTRGIPSRKRQRIADIGAEVRRLAASGTAKTVIARRLAIGISQVGSHLRGHPLTPPDVDGGDDVKEVA